MWPGKEKGEDIGYKLRYLWDSRRQASNSRVQIEKRRRKQNNVQCMTNKSIRPTIGSQKSSYLVSKKLILFEKFNFNESSCV